MMYPKQTQSSGWMKWFGAEAFWCDSLHPMLMFFLSCATIEGERMPTNRRKLLSFTLKHPLPLAEELLSNM